MSPAAPKHRDRAARPPKAAIRKKVNLALQGGGAHGAFTWGVLDGVIEDGRIQIDGISGTSAGAINAVMVADGFARGGPQEACKRLGDFWRAASVDGNLPAMQRTVIDRLFSFFPLEGSAAHAWFDAVSRFWSPYDFNPLNINPLRDVINRFVDFDAVRDYPGPPLFVSATNVHTGRLRVFPRPSITTDVVMASACLPLFFRAVEIEGVPYWDGGYMGNPAIFPFFGTTETEDVLLVQINPIERRATPQSQNEIVNRINEITFNSSLLAEYRAIDFVIRLIDQGKLPRGMGPGQYRRINLHRIALDGIFETLTADSKMETDYDFFEMLRDGGRRAAQDFLRDHFDDIGQRSTFDLQAESRAEWA
jgi:NTE family protein